MASPVSIPFTSFIVLERSSATPIYLQLVTQIINAIQRGFLVKGTPLPGTRTLASVLGVNRNTLVVVYEELEALGWIEIVPNKGAFILQQTINRAEKIPSSTKNFTIAYPSKTGYDFEKSQLLDTPFENSNHTLILNDGIPDIRLLSIHQLTQSYTSSLKRKTHQNKNDENPQNGRIYFKENLSNFLNLTRGLHISTKNLLITRSIEMGIYITSEILISRGDKVIVGELSYFTPNMIFQNSGAQLLTVPVDSEGIDVDAVQKLCENNKIRMLYLTPHHHYPTTATLSAQRRIELLRLSQIYGFIILEDDYEYDFQFGNNQVLPLASADTEGMVVYIGSFGRSLAPGFRTGFIVAPENLIVEMQKFISILDRQGDTFMDYALGNLIQEGDILRHIKKTSLIYKERRDVLAQLIDKYLNEWVNYTLPTGGLAIWTRWDASINLMKLREDCLKLDLHIPKHLLYQNLKISAMRIGFGSFTPQELEFIIHKIFKILRKS
ncbi:PLP-dependent aminotransferase family protein [Apibacter sp. HY039]|uniref:aminotransferase-like domain-containing protein n=1 Tax=Apibacter sp. HY039 TaxID=2501476 RepID=UPI000FEB6E0E|nr:PLP-dependent aminotransferase family protein [Apibacter sp. HY039]